jgi:dihydropteroate synthase
MFDTMAQLRVTYSIMHMHGSPQTMMEDTHYDRLLPEMALYFAEKLQVLHQKGVRDIWIDPGFGFSKTTDHNYTLLNKLEQLAVFGQPLLVGFSRKTMIRDLTGTSPAEALNGTTALHMFALTKGANILRVHDVREAVEVVKIYAKISQS